MSTESFEFLHADKEAPEAMSQSDNSGTVSHEDVRLHTDYEISPILRNLSVYFRGRAPSWAVRLTHRR
jgi:hypothetical protein